MLSLEVEGQGLTMRIADWWQGRVQRTPFWLNTIALWAIFFMVCGRLQAQWLSVFGILAVLVLMAAWGAQCARRLHDTGCSSWWLLLALVPVMGPCWLVWQLGFKQGQSHTNRWGDRPGRY